MRRFILESLFPIVCRNRKKNKLNVDIYTFMLRFLVQEKLRMVLGGGRNSSWPTKPCSTVDGWDYDLSDGMYHTVVSEVNRIAPPVISLFAISRKFRGKL